MASTIKVDNVQNQPGTNIIDKCGTTITLGQSGDTIALACGASQTGFGRTGTVDWVTTVKVTGDSPITAVTGKGYFLNTTAGTITINLPAGVAGSIVSMADYARTWDTYNVTVTPNGSEKIGGATAGNSAVLSTEGQSVTFVYIDGTQGWVNVQDSTSAEKGVGDFITATGGTPCAGATVGDYKVHTFTGPGTFTVSCAGPASEKVDYLVVAGGGGGGASVPGYYSGGGGGAGGFRESVPSPAAWTASPIAASANARPVIVQGYSIVVGGGGAGGAGPGSCSGAQGNTSTFSDIDSAGGGYGGKSTGAPGGGVAGGPGGSGGGGGAKQPGGLNVGGTGNTPPVSPSQGFNGGNGSSNTSGVGGGGGGALGVGDTGTCQPYGQVGGPGATTCISGSPLTKAVGGATGCQPGGTPTTAANSGTGGQSGGDCASTGAGGGSGIVILRYKFQ